MSGSSAAQDQARCRRWRAKRQPSAVMRTVCTSGLPMTAIQPFSAARRAAAWQASYWLEPAEYEQASYREAWERIGHGGT